MDNKDIKYFSIMHDVIKRSLERLQKQKGIFSTHLSTIKEQGNHIKSLAVKMSEDEPVRLLHHLQVINDSLQILEGVYNNSLSSSPGLTDRFYKIYLLHFVSKKSGDLIIEYNDGFLRIKLSKNRYLIILSVLEKYIIDEKNVNIPIELRGTIHLNEISKRVYGNTRGKNKIYSEVSKIRKLLKENGLLDENLLVFELKYLKLNIDSGKVTVINMEDIQ